MEALDLRAARLAGGLKGLTGGVRALACHPALPVLAVVSLDRFLRLYDTQARRRPACGGRVKQPYPTFCLRGLRAAGAPHVGAGAAAACAGPQNCPPLSALRTLAQSRRMLGKVFLKHPPTGVAFCPPVVAEAAAEPAAEPGVVAEAGRAAAAPFRRKKRRDERT